MDDEGVRSALLRFLFFLLSFFSLFVSLELRLIDDLLDITRIAKGKLALNKGRVQLAAVASDAVGMVKHEAGVCARERGREREREILLICCRFSSVVFSAHLSLSSCRLSRRFFKR